jgi:hypothetical protein
MGHLISSDATSGRPGEQGGYGPVVRGGNTFGENMFAMVHGATPVASRRGVQRHDPPTPTALDPHPAAHSSPAATMSHPQMGAVDATVAYPSIERNVSGGASASTSSSPPVSLPSTAAANRSVAPPSGMTARPNSPLALPADSRDYHVPTLDELLEGRGR